MAVVMKNGKNFINCFDKYGKEKKSKQDRKIMLVTNKLVAPLRSWPTDKERLLYLINNYLAQIELDKLTSMADKFDDYKEEQQEEIVDRTEVFTAPVDEEDKTEEESAEGEENNEEVEESTEESADTEETVETVQEEDVVVDEGEYLEVPDQLYECESCSAKVLGSIVRILNYRSKVIRKIRLMRKAKMDNEKINLEIEKVVVYNIVLAKFLPILNKQEIIDKINLKTATKLFEEVCVDGYQEIPTHTSIENEIKKNKEDQDFDIVAALSYCGVSVDKDDYGYYTIKSYNNGKGIKYYIGKAEKSFALSKNSCNRFVDEFLNKPIEKRKFITPGQVFISYINEAEKSLGINSRSAVELNGLFGAMNSTKNTKQYFKDVIKKFSRNAQEWKDFQKLFEGEYYSNKESRDDNQNRVHIKQQAKRLVIGELFEDFINHGDILSNEQIGINDYRISDISRDFGLNINIDGIDVNRVRIEMVEDQAFRIVNAMHAGLQQMRAFTQDIIDNYTVDYLRKEKIFLLQQDDQKEYISKKKDYEDLLKRVSYDKGKDSAAQAAYYQNQIDDLTQKIGNKEYLDAKNTLLKSKNNYRILLINAKSQRDKVIIAINEAKERAEKENKEFTIDDKLEIIKEVLTTAPELIVTFERGRATSWTKHRQGEKAAKKEEPLTQVDKIIEETAARISDESHQKILQENLIREKVKKSQKEERVKSANAYINAYGSIVGSAMGVGALTNPIPNVPLTAGPTFAPQVAQVPVTQTVVPEGIGVRMPSHTASQGGVTIVGGGQVAAQPVAVDDSTVATPRNIASLNSVSTGFSQGGAVGGNDAIVQPAQIRPTVNYQPSGVNSGNAGTTGGSRTINVPPQTTTIAGGQMVNGNGGMAGGVQQGTVGGGFAAMPSGMPAVAGGMYGGAMYGGMMPTGAVPTPPMQQQGQPDLNGEYQNFDFVSEGVEPCIIPYIVGYEDKGATIYGNMMERYAIMDRYKFLLTTNNNLLYSYVEKKREQIQTPEQIISDLHIRYVKNAMAKSGLSTQDSNLQGFDYKGDIRRYLSQYVPQNLIDMVISDYNELIETVDFDLLKDLIDHKFQGDLESYIPEEMKTDVIKSTNMIASVAKVIMSDSTIRKTYDAYSSKMKQTYISSLVGKIDSGELPSVKLESEQMYSRILDYVSFSIKGQNVIIQTEDAKDSGLETYPRSVFFRQKDNADTALKTGKTLTFEQNEILTTRNEPMLSGQDNSVMNLFGTLYKFNGAYNKLLLKLKPMVLTGSVKFMENMLDALNEKIDLKVTVLNQEMKKNNVSLVKFASKEKEKKVSAEDVVFDYDDDNWFVRKGFVLEKNEIKQYYMLLALGFKYGLDKSKKQLKEDFYTDNILSLSKINETFKDLPDETISLLTSCIREIMMSKCERIIDMIAYINNYSSMHINKMLYINRTILESKNFDKKTKDEKLETLIALDKDFDVKSEDLTSPHPEIYSTTAEIERYQNLYLYYGLTELFEKYAQDPRFVTGELDTYFIDLKRKFRSDLLAMIRDKVPMNGYEQDLCKYFELKIDNMKSLDLDDDGIIEDEELAVVARKAVLARIKNIDVIFKGILDGYNKAIKGETNTHVLEEMKEVGELLTFVGELPGVDNEDKELEIALPNNQCIRCNVKGFIQQYLFRFIVDKEHELGPFAYVVSELVEHEEMADVVKNIEIVANKLNVDELGINLIAKFSSINLSNDGNILKIGDNISTVLDTINRLKTPTDQQKALNRDVFYKEGVEGVKEIFEQYFNRLKAENMD